MTIVAVPGVVTTNALEPALWFPGLCGVCGEGGGRAGPVGRAPGGGNVEEERRRGRRPKSILKFPLESVFLKSASPRPGGCSSSQPSAPV